MSLFIQSAEEQYNDLVEYISDCHREVFGHVKSSVYAMIENLTEAAHFKKKHSDLIDDNLKHSQAMAGNMLKMFLDLAEIENKEG